MPPIAGQERLLAIRASPYHFIRKQPESFGLALRLVGWRGAERPDALQILIKASIGVSDLPDLEMPSVTKEQQPDL
jgi:hypothetical protein